MARCFSKPDLSVVLLILSIFVALPGCKPRDGAHDSAALRDTGAICSRQATWKGEVVGNFAAISPLNQPFLEAPSSPENARKKLAALYPESCREAMEQHLRTAKPNIYIHFTGFGGAEQDNQTIDEGALMKWINNRDPKALIIAMSWDCLEAVAAGDGWCQQEAARIAVKRGDPSFNALERSFKTFATNEAEATKMIATVTAFANQSQLGYNTALAHSMLNAARVINHAVKADEDAPIGQINITGYSMGAHAASELLIQDFRGDAKGFEWAVSDACAGGGQICQVAKLKKVGWSLAMGLSGWADSLVSYNKSRRADRAQFENGGLIRIKDQRYQNKLNVLNRRMDPTGNSDDTFQRAINDMMLGDYNHYAHDYSLPLFAHTPFLRILDAFVEAKNPTSLLELGILTDNAGFVDFDECGAVNSCVPKSYYLAHRTNRSHGDIRLMEPGSVKITAGVPQPAVTDSRAADFTGETKAMRMYTMDQEDLRGAVELYYMPKFDLAAAGVHGIFSYGSCSVSEQELMPTAYIENGKLFFSANWQGKTYKVEVDLARRRAIARDKWVHLSFNWELPVVPLTAPNAQEGELAANKDKVLPHIAKYGKSIIVANGLRRPSATTFKEQIGVGYLRIYMNGQKLAEAPLGEPSSRRECLPAAQVLNDVSYEVVPGTSYPPHLPYANYTKQTGDIVALDQNTILGTKCKAFKIRNEKVFFGCAKRSSDQSNSDLANAEAYMDDVTLIFGAGRKTFGNVGAGVPAKWQMGQGIDYSATPFVVR